MFGKTVDVKLIDPDRQDRTVGIVIYVGTMNLNAEFLRLGYALGVPLILQAPGMQGMEIHRSESQG